MSTAKVRLSRVFVVLGLVFGGFEAAVLAQPNAQAGDLMGGAAIIFQRPQNPKVHRSKDARRISTGAQNRTQSEQTSQPATTSDVSDVSDQVEDALALGNAARDRTPPDFESAEKAYRLGWKLNSKDPRPFVGLGNLYFDQGRLAEAAKAYREAVMLMEPPRAKVRVVRGKLHPRLKPKRNRPKNIFPSAEWRVYLANTLLRQNNATEAELEIRSAISTDPQNASWHALLGYDLVTQGRYTEASEAYRVAAQLELGNGQYHELWKQSLTKANSASAQDVAIKRSLEGSKWEIERSDNPPTKGRCELKGNNVLRCTWIDNNSRYIDSRWNVLNGLFRLESVQGRPFCIGKVQEERIDLKCPFGKAEVNEVWLRRTVN